MTRNFARIDDQYHGGMNPVFLVSAVSHQINTLKEVTYLFTYLANTIQESLYILTARALRDIAHPITWFTTGMKCARVSHDNMALARSRLLVGARHRYARKAEYLWNFRLLFDSSVSTILKSWAAWHVSAKDLVRFGWYEVLLSQQEIALANLQKAGGGQIANQKSGV